MILTPLKRDPIVMILAIPPRAQASGGHGGPDCADYFAKGGGIDWFHGLSLACVEVLTE